MTNRLAKETSPYLLQHAENPVDWYAWGPEAFAAARERGVPIFLSVGYSTCYWCHVMERESFEDAATAAVMNDGFVCVKVDREERPDVDDVYMVATQLMTGSGGWPMSVFLEPDGLRPFWCGTYFPRAPMHGRPSFVQVLVAISEAWSGDRGGVLEQAERLSGAVREHLADPGVSAALGSGEVERAVSSLLTMFDRRDGGFGSSPKFPQPVYGEFLLEARGMVDEETREGVDHAVRFTLDRMALGGLFDHVGGGFHRYCVDATWTVPHFEKMLYDNALLASVYARAALVYGDAFYGRVVRRTLDYVLREMTGEHGGFFSAQDAEVEGREGQNYLWTAEGVRGALDGESAAFALDIYGINAGGNFRDPHFPEAGAKSVLRLDARPGELAARRGVSEDELLDRLDAVNSALYRARMTRAQPGVDDKSVAAWNGMMIVAMVEGGAAVGERGYGDAAERAARFVLGSMVDGDGLVRRSYRDGRTGETGVLEDQGWLVLGLLSLHGSGRGSGGYLEAAASIAEAVHGSFARDDGAYTDVRGGREDLFVRGRSVYDGATPSGAGVMLHALLGLDGAFGGEGPWRDRAIEQLGRMSGEIAKSPVGAVNSVRAVMRLLSAGESGRLGFGPALDDDGRGEGAGGSGGVVEVYADSERLEVSDGRPAVLTLGVRIKEGYHVLAAEPSLEGGGSVEGLVPLRVGLVSGQGVAVYADYPEGEAYGFELVGRDELRVHTGELRLRVVVEKAEGIGAGPGAPVLGMTFQACDDSSCLEPATLRLGVEVVVG